MRVFLDTNIFLYSAAAAHPQRDACASILRRVASGSLDATVNSEVLQEILYVLTRRGRREDGLMLAKHVSALFPNLMPVTREDMTIAYDLLLRYSRLSVRDAVHAATMLRNGLNTIISVDGDFDQLSQLRRVAPESA